MASKDHFEKTEEMDSNVPSAVSEGKLMYHNNGEITQIKGLKTFIIKAGSGHPLVFIHGGSPGACSQISWKKNIDYFVKSGFSVYAFDQPGFGQTENPEDFSLEYRVSHAKSFIDAMQLSNFYLVGNSQGGYIATRVALEDERTKGLVIVSSGTLAPTGSSEAQELGRRHAEKLRQYTPSIENARLLTTGTLFNKNLVDEIVQERYEMSTGKNFEAQMARRKAPSAKPIHQELQNLKVKTLILWGNNDGGASVERAFPLFKIIPKAELHIFDQCAHWVQWDQAARFNRLVTDFLLQLGPSA